jgi:beta-lactamase class C
MAQPNLRGAALAILGAAILLPITGRAANDDSAVAPVIGPLMARYGIPGMAVGVVANGHRQVYDFGVASKATRQPVTEDTLFEIGSISKAFTATLAAYAQVTGKLSLSDPASKDLPSLRGSSFDRVSLINLGTHTAGGLPLQLPDEITNDDQLMAYFRGWQPTYPPGTTRVYGNPGIGLLGVIAAQSLNTDFGALMEGKLFPALGLKNTYLDVPEARMASYAQGYTAADKPVRLTPGMLGSETYGVRTTAGDLLRFVEANMRLLDLDEALQRALTDTHTGYYRIGAMTQDLIWEQYRYPVDLPELLAGNAGTMIFEPNPATELAPPLPPQEAVLINKTGSTNGFGAYVAFIPEKKTGIVLLANKSYPIEARVTAAYDILTRLGAPSEASR